ncbi:MAG TPA: response regulator transcription factor [Clostridiales bacterium]|jgi:two-component system alkaline phosphatase synthesis response regulator PhoP|nr:response regulator transcription factor [Clostridiales bacterium]
MTKEPSTDINSKGLGVNKVKRKVLIVDDERSIRSFIKVGFERSNFEIIEAETGEEGIMLAREYVPDIVVLDIMLPGIDGFEVCTTLRTEFPDMGIIMLTARDLDMDRIMGLEHGADDYVVKPFNPLELVLRAEALLRRIGKNDSQEDDRKLYDWPFEIDTYSQKVYKNNMEVELTPKEYQLMKLFIENPGKLFSRNELIDTLWGSDFMGDLKIVDVNIRRLRKRIEDNPSRPKFIETVWGIGYRWREK